MFKMFHMSKKVARMQVNHLLNVNILDIIWSSFHIFNFEQAS